MIPGHRRTLGFKQWAELGLDGEKEIWIWADRLIEEHGNEAVLEARDIARQLLHEGDQEGYAVWKLIVKAIESLEQRGPGAGESIH